MATWPLITDLIAAAPQELPIDLMKSLTQRYEQLGEKYATDEIHEKTGLKINSCMHRDTLQELYEELVDAMFNCLVYLFRFPGRGSSRILFGVLLDACIEVEAERERYGSSF